jgi:hypothetical protein
LKKKFLPFSFVNALEEDMIFNYKHTKKKERKEKKKTILKKEQTKKKSDRKGKK